MQQLSHATLMPSMSELPRQKKTDRQPVQYAFDAKNNSITRTILRRDGSSAKSSIEALSQPTEFSDIQALFDLSFLRTKNIPKHSKPKKTIRIVDLFAGCGAMSLGAWEACRALESEMKSLMAVDINAASLNVYGRNFPGTEIVPHPVESIVDSPLGEKPSALEKKLAKRLGEIDLLVGGPPCQGHSDLNNHTRRADPKNTLILQLVRFAEITQPKHIIIENVQGIKHDKSNAATIARQHLESLGYSVEEGLVTVSEIGVSQKRRRFVMIASRVVTPAPISEIVGKFGNPRRPISWALRDLLNIKSSAIYDQAAVHSETNRARIDYLFEHDLYELPDHARPDCHRLKKHSYNSVYGRMHWDDVAPTITTGFGSCGQGRFVHPLRRRTLTPHEAARIQFIPDFFDFGDSQRRQLQEMIGNAVPPKLSFILALELLR
jgi:DNA (cytosine-5)-methyltransferase 1